MKAHKLFLGFLLWLIPFTLSAQRTISGRITDAETGGPVPGANVFFAGTTVGATSDTTGYYRLIIPGEGSYRLAISHVAYEPIFMDIDPGKASEILNVTMEMATMEEVTVSAKVRFRKYDIDLFWRTILGQKPSKTIQPLNPEAVYYYFDSSTGILKVTCRVPLQIVNYETGYHIYYFLNYFTHDYIKNITVWDGEYMFSELEPKSLTQKNVWDKNRKYVYSVSITKFIKSLYHNTLLEDGFLLVWEHKQEFRVIEIFNDPRLGIYSTTALFKNVEGTSHDKIDSDLFLSIDSITGEKKFYVPPEMKVMLINFGMPVPKSGWATNKWNKTGLFRTFVTTSDSVRIFSDGSYQNRIGFASIFESNPIWGLNLVLPREYYPDGHTGDSRYFTKDGEDEQPMKIMSENPLTDTLFRVVESFGGQLSGFPQEKIHLQTDKPYYLSGERIWFRAHVVDAATHIPSFESGSVYVELFDARDSVVCRVKSGLANDFFSGYIPIPENIPEGDYIIRAYTSGMRDLDEDYFFMKSIRIGDPMSRIVHAQSEFEFLPDKNIGAEIRFSRLFPSASITPESLKISINDGKSANVRCVDGVSGLSFNLPSSERQRVMLLDAMYEKNPFRQYIKIPLPDDDFDVSLFPEGGSALYGCEGRIAFKAMQRDGTDIDVEGTVYDSHGNELTQFKTDVRGMGQFRMRYEHGETYYAIVTNSKGQSKRFELPAARENGYALSASWFRDRLIVNVHQPESQKTGDTLCLIVHTRGVVQDARIWENTGEPVIYQKDFFPSGVTHLLLLTKEMIPVSERLVFANYDDQAKVEGKSDRETYSPRSPVEYTIHITDETDEPLIGNFSVSVTDDHEVKADTTTSILTSLLLSSDLRGAIPEPAYYFRKNNQSSFALDLLMLTQGWRRYDVERIVKNDLMYPDTLLEKKHAISGAVRNRSSLRQRPAEDAIVTILSTHGNFSKTTFTDRNGRFYLPDVDLPDSTAFLIAATPQQSNQILELTLDKPSYPDRTIPVVASVTPDREVFAQYADKAEQQYVDEYGTRIIQIEEVTITAQAPGKKGKDYSFFYKSQDAQFVLTEEEIARMPPANIRSLLNRIPGIFIGTSVTDENNPHGSIPKVTYGNNSVLFVIDNHVEDNEDFNIFDQLAPADIAQVDLLSGSAAGVFTFRSTTMSHYVISITTKRGKLTPRETPYIKHFIPLGIQKPTEFYAPKYDTPAQNTKPDLRTTIHWQPNITTDERGNVSFSFYTADAPSTYTVTIEGITEDGRIVYKRDKIVVK